jgi:hypothetical protein
MTFFTVNAKQENKIIAIVGFAILGLFVAVGMTTPNPPPSNIGSVQVAAQQTQDACIVESQRIIDAANIEITNGCGFFDAPVGTKHTTRCETLELVKAEAKIGQQSCSK